MAFLPAIAAGVSIAAGGASIFSGLMGGRTGAAAARYQGAVDANMALISAENTARTLEAKAEADLFNAEVAEQMAGSETHRAGAEASDFRRAESARLSSSRARQAASGFELEGSPLMVDENIFTQAEFGAQRVAHAGQVTSTRLRNEAKLLRRSSLLGRESAWRAREAGKQTAEYAVQGGDIRGGAASIAGYGDAAKSAAAMGQTLSNISSTPKPAG